MRRSERLKVVADLFSRRETAEARRLGELQQGLSREETRLSELNQYREEYEDALRHPHGQSTTVNRIQVYHQFISRLNSAIAAQQEALQRLEEQIREQQQRWREAHTRRKNMDSYIERLRQGEDVEAEKALQKALDDMQSSRTGNSSLQ